MLESKKELQKIVFFDGVCHLCNGFVDFALRNETGAKSLLFAPLQGPTAARMLPETDKGELKTILYWDGKTWFRKSTAVLQIAQSFRFPYPLFAKLAEAVPVSLRDWVYDGVAARRYAWFGKLDQCRLPQPDEKSQLLE